MRRLILAAGLIVPSIAQAQLSTYGYHHATKISVEARQPWARATAPRQTSAAVYTVLTSPTADKLIGGSSPVGTVQIHVMKMDGDIMRMRQVESVDLPAGQPVALEPGGYHVMLVDVKHPLKASETVPVTLQFEHAPPLKLDVRIEPIGASGPGMATGAAASGEHGAMPGMDHGSAGAGKQ